MRALCLFLAVAACGSPDDPRVKVDIPPEHVAAVNALIPTDWISKIQFEVGPIVDQTGRNKEVYKLAVPKGWTAAQGPIGGKIAPPDADHFGRSAALGAQAELRVGFNCNGECKAKDWAVEVDRTFYAKFTKGESAGKVTKDDKRDTGRTLVFERAASDGSADGEVNILTTWWKPGGSAHFICEAKLAGSAVALAPAFEKACSLVSAE